MCSNMACEIDNRVYRIYNIYKLVYLFLYISMPTSTHAETLFRKHQGMLRTTQATSLGIAPRTLYQMRDDGALVELARGLFRLARLPSLSQPDLVTTALKVPKGVICLISALAYHDLTTQIPHQVDLALPAGTPAPQLTYPPIQVFHFSKESYQSGIEAHEIDGVTVHIYSAEKTVVDCFKFRNQLGMEIVLEALKRYRERKGFRVDRLYNFAKVCRMTNVMRPYLEMVV